MAKISKEKRVKTSYFIGDYRYWLKEIDYSKRVINELERNGFSAREIECSDCWVGAMYVEWSEKHDTAHDTN